MNNTIGRRLYERKCRACGVEPIPGIGRVEIRKYKISRCHKRGRPRKPIEERTYKKIKGVSFEQSRGKWRAYMKVGGKYQILGRFLHWDKAVECVRAYARQP